MSDTQKADPSKPEASTHEAADIHSEQDRDGVAIPEIASLGATTIPSLTNAPQEGASPAERRTLTFEDDPGATRSAWMAGLLLIVIVGWMGSGFILPANDEGTEPVTVAVPGPVAVAVKASTAEPVTLLFQAEGQALPDRDTTIRAEASGDVAEVLVRKGEDVSEGQLIARLSSSRFEADLNRAVAERDRATREMENATALFERGVSTVDRVVQAQAALAAAEAAVTAATEALDSTRIIAPFDGRIETLSLDVGEFISAGSEVGRIVDNQPLTIALRVPQQALRRIRSGQTSTVSFITGEERQGRVTFVGTSASAETRTFLAEIEVDNPDGTIPAGISAEIRIPTGEVQAHFIAPSVVSLGPEGITGVKTVENGTVVFYPIQVVRAEVDGIWVTGLPERAEIITIGQGYVRAGERVDARPENPGQPGTTASEETGE